MLASRAHRHQEVYMSILNIIHGRSDAQQPADAYEAAVWKAMEVGSTAGPVAACGRVRRAARRILRRPAELGVGQLKLVAGLAYLTPIMAAEAAELLGETRVFIENAGEPIAVSLRRYELAELVEALEAFLRLHRDAPLHLRS
jgi:hypothetical protein